MGDSGDSKPTDNGNAIEGIAQKPDSIVSIVSQAEQLLQQRDQQAQARQREDETKRDKVAALLQNAIDLMDDNPNDDNVDFLKKAIEAAQSAKVSPQLRVQARRVLAEHVQEQQQIDRMEKTLERLAEQATQIQEEVVKEELSPAQAAVRRRREDLLLHQLLNSAEQALFMPGVRQELIDKVRSAAENIESSRRQKEESQRQLQGLMSLKDPDAIECKLHMVGGHAKENLGRGVQILVKKLEEKRSHLARRKKYQQWLQTELSTAAEQKDVLRMQQLVQQAKTLELPVPPAMMSTLHEFESHMLPPVTSRTSASEKQGQGTGATPSVAGPAGLRVQRSAAAEAAMARAEKEPSVQAIDAARQAVAEALHAKVAPEEIRAFQKRLSNLEQAHTERFTVEEKLRRLLQKVQGAAQGSPALAADTVSLRQALDEAQWLLADVDDKLLEAAERCLEEKSQAESQRIQAEQVLLRALERPARGDADLEQLKAAVTEARRVGIAVPQAERELARRREAQVRREASEAELLEASKSKRPQDRARLEAAIRDAKAAGVGAEALREASQRLDDLTRHEQRCALMVGNLRRLFPTLPKEPWRLIEITEAAESLKPWTLELERQLARAQEVVDQTLSTKEQRTKTESEMQALLNRIDSGKQTATKEIEKELQELLVKAQALDARPALVNQAEEQLQELRRQFRKRDVAKHRLKLALTARDLGEIECAVRVLGEGSPGATTSREHYRMDQPPSSARLMDAAQTMMRHLGDKNSRRQAVEAALLERISDSGSVKGAEKAGQPRESLLNGGSPEKIGDPEQAEVAWMTELDGLLREAKQTGVAPSLIEHAKLKLREKRRQAARETQAKKDLQRALAKKDISEKEVAHHLRRVQRLRPGGG